MASTVWKGHLTFGLISVPVRLSAAARKRRPEFNLINPETGGRVKQMLWDPIAETFVTRSKCHRAIEQPDGTMLVVTEEERKAAEPASSKMMEVLHFVPIEDINPLLFDASYHLAPDENGEGAFGLLYGALTEMGRAAVAKLCRAKREHLVVIWPNYQSRCLVLHTLFYADEVREAPACPSYERKDELELAKLFIDRMTRSFEHDGYRDEYRHAIAELVEAKAKGLEVKTPEAPAKPSNVLDLMTALKESLEALGKAS